MVCREIAEVVGSHRGCVEGIEDRLPVERSQPTRALGMPRSPFSAAGRASGQAHPSQALCQRRHGLASHVPARRGIVGAAGEVLDRRIGAAWSRSDRRRSAYWAGWPRWRRPSPRRMYRPKSLDRHWLAAIAQGGSGPSLAGPAPFTPPSQPPHRPKVRVVITTIRWSLPINSSVFLSANQAIGVPRLHDSNGGDFRGRT